MDEGGVSCELFTFITVSAHICWTYCGSAWRGMTTQLVTNIEVLRVLPPWRNNFKKSFLRI
jgi:hypothetical protein